MKLFDKFLTFLYPALIIALTAIICYRNYTPNTFLTGWDTLHPEFNFQKQFENIFYGVFRNDQGLGAVAAHSHMSELPRLIFLWLESFILPLSFLRYSYVFLCFILGPLGIYYFLKNALNSSENKGINLSSVNQAAFIGALVYIFNLGTIQHFYVPFEMFVTQYAALGWMFLSVYLILKKTTVKRVLIFVLLSFFFSSMAYAAVLFYAYFVALILFLVIFVLLRKSKQTTYSALIIIAAVFASNTYWMLPNFYFLATTAKEVSLAQTNRIFSDEAFLHNKQYGNIVDTAILKNFLFNWSIQVNENVSQNLLLSWKNHINNFFILIIGYFVFALTIFGIILSFIKKNKVLISLLPIFLIALIMLMNMNFPFDFFFSLLRDNFSLFKEGLRFPFTKFSLLLMFSYSIFSSYSIFLLLQSTNKATQYLGRNGIRLKDNYLKIFILAALSISLVIYGFPMFNGELVSKKMRINIPSEYFQLFNFLNTKSENLRIAPLPVHSLWGWEYYNWGYQGAGFLWFGIKQPILARDFDRWNPNNEKYYREISDAIYSRDYKKLETIARKYKIGYFLLDKNIIFPGNKQNALWFYETEQTFKNSKNIRLVKKFNNLSLYEVSLNFLNGKLIDTPEKIISVGPSITGGFVDLAAQAFGDYVVLENPNYFYPSRNLVDRYDRINANRITSYFDKTVLELSSIPNGYEFTTSWLDEDIFPEFIRRYKIENENEKSSLPYRVGSSVFIDVPISTQEAQFKPKIEKSTECGITEANSISKLTFYNDYTRLESKKGSSCAFVDFPSIKQDFGSILSFSARNTKGLPIRLCVSNKLTRRCDIYTTLDNNIEFKKYVFMIAPQPSGDSGYAVNLNNVSIGNEVSINDIKDIRINQIPFYRIQNLYFRGKDIENNSLILQSYKKINPLTYTANLEKTGNNIGLINFFKAYDNGWQAYEFTKEYSNFTGFLNKFFPFLYGKKLNNHVLTNNWANGWFISENEVTHVNNVKIIIIFLPQYLEYAGFLIFTIFIIIILMWPAISMFLPLSHTKILEDRRRKYLSK